MAFSFCRLLDLLHAWVECSNGGEGKGEAYCTPKLHTTGAKCFPLAKRMLLFSVHLHSVELSGYVTIYTLNTKIMKVQTLSENLTRASYSSTFLAHVPLSLISRLEACSGRIVVDRQTHRTTTVTLGAHAQRGYCSYPRRACAARVL